MPSHFRAILCPIKTHCDNKDWAPPWSKLTFCSQCYLEASGIFLALSTSQTTSLRLVIQLYLCKYCDWEHLSICVRLHSWPGLYLGAKFKVVFTPKPCALKSVVSHMSILVFEGYMMWGSVRCEKAELSFLLMPFPSHLIWVVEVGEHAFRAPCQLLVQGVPQFCSNLSSALGKHMGETSEESHFCSG